MIDQDAIVKYCPFLINEMMNILTQVWLYSKYMNKPKTTRSKDSL